MKMTIRAAGLLALLVSAVLPPAATAARRLRLSPRLRSARGPKPWDNLGNLTRRARKTAVKASAAAKGTEKHVHAGAVEVHPAVQAPVMVVEEVPVMVVEQVPVMQIVLVRDRQQGAPSFEDSGLFAAKRQGPSGVASNGISGSCKEEMMRFEKNRSRVVRARFCEEMSNSTRRAVQALERADISAASAAAAQTFHDCAGVSKGCAEQVAPQIVLTIRLSGAAVSQTCADAVNGGPPPNKSHAVVSCERNATRFMVKALNKRDMPGCLHAAEHGLHTCGGIKPPCDFQLAGLLVANVLQAGAAAPAPQQVEEVLLAGLRAAAELTREMMAQEVPMMAARGNASHAASEAEAAHPAAASTKGATEKAAPTKVIAKSAAPKNAVPVRAKEASPVKPATNHTSPQKVVSEKGKKPISLISIAGRARVVPVHGPFRF